MVFSMAACSSSSGGETTPATTPVEESGAVETTAATDMKVAMITDYGDITDQSFNQTTYEACKEFCDANGILSTISPWITPPPAAWPWWTPLWRTATT